MKIFSFLVSVIIAATATAQKSSEKLKQHKILVAQSKSAQKGISSLDTIFCSGQPSALVQIVKRDSLTGNILEQRINSLVDGSMLVRVTRVDEYVSATRVRTIYSKYYFPALELMCRTKSGKGEMDVYETICHHGLLRSGSLDTMNAEIFVTLKGRMHESEPFSEPVMEKGVILKRNKLAPILFKEEFMEQDGLMIGEVKLDTIAGPKGPLKKYSIYNITGALICTATQGGTASTEWRLLTYKDNSFHAMTSTTGDDREDILRFLIRKEFL